MTYPDRWKFDFLADGATAAASAEVDARAEGFAAAWRPRVAELGNAAVLSEALGDWTALEAAGDPAPYLMDLRRMLDQSDAVLRARADLMEAAARRRGNLLRFFDLALAQLPGSLANEPSLAPWRHLLQRAAATRPYLLGEEAERAVSLLSKPAFSNWTDMTEEFLSAGLYRVTTDEGSTVDVPMSGLFPLLLSSQKPVRDAAAAHVDAATAAHEAVAVHELNSVLEWYRARDELRGYGRPEAARFLADDIAPHVVDAMLRAVETGYGVPRRFYALKSKLLGLERLAYHERNVPVGELGGIFPYQEAVELTASTLGAVDPEFETIVRSFAEQGRVDAPPAPGKRGGACCTHHSAAEPTYLLLNHADRLQDVLTLAHECGHGINNELVRAAQPPHYFGTPLSTAEVASTFMEDFVLERVGAGLPPEGRQALRMAKLNDDVSTIYRQVACFRFEQDLHRFFRAEGYLDAARIGGLFDERMGAYMGDAVERPASSRAWWTYWSHVRYGFYVYSYASGLLISKALQRLVRRDPSRIVDVKRFLSAGLSEAPAETFARLGIDIADPAFWAGGLAEVEEMLAEAEAEAAA